MCVQSAVSFAAPSKQDWSLLVQSLGGTSEAVSRMSCENRAQITGVECVLGVVFCRGLNTGPCGCY